MNKRLTHIDDDGTARMVDVGNKPVTQRIAVAQSVVCLAPDTLQMLTQGNLPKGDALGCARIGAILAAKHTSSLIPLCHSVPLSQIDIDFEIDADNSTIRIIATTKCTARTGVEMEAIIAAQTAAAIIYDMCKAVQRDIVINDTRLLHKSGGKSGEFNALGFTAGYAGNSY